MKTTKVSCSICSKSFSIYMKTSKTKYGKGRNKKFSKNLMLDAGIKRVPSNHLPKHECKQVEQK